MASICDYRAPHLLIASVFFMVSTAFWTVSTAAGRPNVVVIMVDDLVLSDAGCYVGEIETSNLDALASRGLRFSPFYGTAKCDSSRVSLLS